MVAPPPLRQDESNLDLLRAFAVLAVLAAHTFGVVAGSDALMFGVDPWELGRIGVSIFFVHTSLVLFGSLDRSEQAGRFSIGDFYLRRAFRIYPLAMACVLAVLVFNLPASPTRPEDLPRGGVTVFANLLLIQDLLNAEPMIGALWSLPIEVEMYVVLPLLYLLGRKARVKPMALALVLGACAAAPLIAELPIPGLYRLSVLSWAPCFGAGFLAWVGMGRIRRKLPAWLWPIGICIAVALFLPTGNSDAKAASRSWVMCTVLGVMIPLFTNLQAPWIVQPARIIARYSYGIYLLHQGWLYLAFVQSPGRSIAVGWLIFGLGLTATTLIGYHFIEEPGIAAGRRLANQVAMSRGPFRA
jgi:peptidoglycan/LPS O-acetylase OafA/YrhL